MKTSILMIRLKVILPFPKQHFSAHDINARELEIRTKCVTNKSPQTVQTFSDKTFNCSGIFERKKPICSNHPLNSHLPIKRQKVQDAQGKVIYALIVKKSYTQENPQKIIHCSTSFSRKILPDFIALSFLRIWVSAFQIILFCGWFKGCVIFSGIVPVKK